MKHVIIKLKYIITPQIAYLNLVSLVREPAERNYVIVELHNLLRKWI